MQTNFPLVKVSGSYGDIGHAIGTQMGKVIREIILESKQQYSDYASYLEASRSYFELTEVVFPQYMLELRAIAKAAGVSEYDYFLFNNHEVFDPEREYDLAHAADHCTIAVSKNAHGSIVGHNEDWHATELRQLYLLDATINDTRFFSLNYAVTIPGLAAGINNWGLIQCINTLHSVSKMGVPRNFIARAILECKSIDEAVKLFELTKRGSGYNHVLVQGTTLVNIEVSGHEVAIDKIESDTYVHTNHFISLLDAEEFHTKSSEARFVRATELVRPKMTIKNMQTLLADTENKANPICREDETIASLVFDTTKNDVYICRGHPCANEFISYNALGQ